MHPKERLDRYGLRAHKSLGQNFLWDENILEKIAGAAMLQPADNVVEVGPGLGDLTRRLARAVGSVTAVELDERLFPPLHEALADLKNVTLRHADILACPPAAFFPGQPYKVVANVPYYITAAILRHFLESEHRPVLLVLTVQKEVADRLVAAPGNLSLLAVSVRFYGTVEKVDVIKAGAFWPRPDVDSAVVRINCQAQTAWEIDEARFFRVVRAGFAQKRKQLQKNLRALGIPRPQISAALVAAGIEGRRRAETLDIPEWVALTQALAD